LKQIEKKIRGKEIIILCGITAIAVACLPLLQEGLLAGHDIWYHLLRIENLKIGIEEGMIPAKVGPMYLNYHGYAVSLCYPDIFLYFPAALRVLGVGIMDSYKCYLAVTVILCYLTTYYCGRKITKDSYAAAVAAILYTLCQYHICTLHTRAAVGEIQAFVFFPLVIYGLYDLIFEDFQKPFVMGLGFWGLMMCHSISLAISLCISVVAVLSQWKRVLVSWKKMRRLLWTAALTLLASIGFWLPFLEQLLSNTFYFSHPWADVTVMALDLKRLFSVNRDIYNFGIIFFAFLSLRFFCFKKISGDEKRPFIDWFLLGGALLLWATTKYFPWGILKSILNSIQFPFRLYSPAAVFLSIGIAMMLVRIWGGKKSILVTTVFLSLFALAFYHYDTTEKVFLENDYYDYAWNSFNVYYKEWLPDNVDIELLKEERVIRNADGSETEAVTEKSGMVRFCPKNGVSYYDIPLVWYKGYCAYTLLADGTRRELDVVESDYNGLLRIMAEEEVGDEIVVYYGGTKIQSVAGALNGLVLASLAGFGVRRRILDGKREETSGI
jgi:hypothetical protein